MTQIWRTTKGNGLVIIFVIFMLFVGYEAWRFFYGPRWFANLERNARKVITAEQLQVWATNLVAVYQTNDYPSFTPGDLGTNFPKQLLGLSPREPFVQVFPPSGPDSPGTVIVAWGAGATYGERGFIIGPPGLSGSQRANEWKPGVYFFRR